MWMFSSLCYEKNLQMCWRLTQFRLAAGSGQVACIFHGQSSQLGQQGTEYNGRRGEETACMRSWPFVAHLAGGLSGTCQAHWGNTHAAETVWGGEANQRGVLGTAGKREGKLQLFVTLVCVKPLPLWHGVWSGYACFHCLTGRLLLYFTNLHFLIRLKGWLYKYIYI